MKAVSVQERHSAFFYLQCSTQRKPNRRREPEIAQSRPCSTTSSACLKIPGGILVDSGRCVCFNPWCACLGLGTTQADMALTHGRPAVAAKEWDHENACPALAVQDRVAPKVRSEPHEDAGGPGSLARDLRPGGEHQAAILTSFLRRRCVAMRCDATLQTSQKFIENDPAVQISEDRPRSTNSQGRSSSLVGSVEM